MKSILVAGDSIIDRYWHCTPEAISSEAPTIRWKVCKKEDKLGGATNVAANLRGLQRTYKTRFKVACMVAASAPVRAAADKEGISGYLTKAIYSRGQPAVKHRFVYDEPYQQLLKVDEVVSGPTKEERNLVAQTILRERFDVGVVADHGYGGVSRGVLAAVRKSCATVIIDPSSKLCEEYIGFADLITPNLDELDALTGYRAEQHTMYKKLNDLADRMAKTTVVLKRGKDGCLTATSGQRVASYPGKIFRRPMIDPLGAGDSFAATLAYHLVSNATLDYAIYRANYVAGISTRFPGCWIPNRDDMRPY